jgi:hypothetical protein
MADRLRNEDLPLRKVHKASGKDFMPACARQASCLEHFARQQK